MQSVETTNVSPHGSNTMLGTVRGNNELVPMTRRYPNLPQKVLRRDSIIAKKIIDVWDNEHHAENVLYIYLKEHKNLSDERYWELMRTVWIIAGSVATATIFRKLMTANRRSKYYFSTPEEAKKLRELPETFEVYRATNDENDGGLSWTLSKEYAEWYQQAYQKEKVICRTVNRKDVFAFIERNKEAEIVIL
ncbi:MAG: hypothetical protein LC109_04425 [Bacteroidia bacterium]|nr:hypothetical protein [Bacteroidia bacterium]